MHFGEGWAGKTGMVLANNVVINPTGFGVDVHNDGAIAAANLITHNVVSGLVYWAEGQAEAFPEGFLPGAGYSDVAI